MKRKLIMLSCVFALLMSSVAFAMGSQVEQKAVVTGVVTSTVAPGTNVKMGDSLVEISTLTGTTAASRATANGVVKQVLVKVGDNITPGEVVVYIETN